MVEENEIKKELNYIILYEIVRIREAGIYDSLIKDNFSLYNLKNNYICHLSSELFKIAPIEIWDNFKIN